LKDRLSHPGALSLGTLLYWSIYTLPILAVKDLFLRRRFRASAAARLAFRAIWSRRAGL